MLLNGRVISVGEIPLKKIHIRRIDVYKAGKTRFPETMLTQMTQLLSKRF
jgi:hypothetical protein